MASALKALSSPNNRVKAASTPVGVGTGNTLCRQTHLGAQQDAETDEWSENDSFHKWLVVTLNPGTGLASQIQEDFRNPAQKRASRTSREALIKGWL